MNNAGVGFGRSIKETVTVNTLGPKRINDEFMQLLNKEGGRIVNIASASGPNFVAKLADEEKGFYQDYDLGWDDVQRKMEGCWYQPDYDNTGEHWTRSEAMSCYRNF